MSELKFSDKKKRFVADGKIYRLKKEKFDKAGDMVEATFDVVDEKEYNERLKKVAGKLQDKIDGKKLLVDVLRDLPTDIFNKLEKKVERMPFTRFRTGGCSTLQVGRGKQKIELIVR